MFNQKKTAKGAPEASSHLLDSHCQHSFCSENEVLRGIDLEPQRENSVANKKSLGGGWFGDSRPTTPNTTFRFVVTAAIPMR